MSEQYKYEPIFGDQSLFDGAPEDAVSVRYGKSEYIFDSEEIKATTGQLRDVPVVAMRRIIPAPKRWTMEDQKAGRLPEVGSMICFINDMKQVEFAGTDGGNYLWYFKRDSGAFGSAYFNCFKPIETTEEKARRERREWGEKASAVFINSSSNPFTSIYDALLSGELPMPKNEDE